MSTLSQCPACGASADRPFLHIPNVPVECNLLMETEEDARAVARGDIALALCRRCGLIWNTAFDPGSFRYDASYENSLWSSPTFQAYARALIDRLILQYDIHGKEIIGVGSGRGEFLEALCERGGNEALGFDPAYALAEGLPGPHVHMVGDYFRERYAEIEADVFVCRHVLEHLADPAGLLRLIRRSLSGRPGALFHAEVPNAAFMLRRKSVWDVIYEHPNYFVEPSLTSLFRRSGFQVQHSYTGFGDQYLGLEAMPLERTAPMEPLASDAIGRLEDDVERFHRAYRSMIDAWADRLARWSRNGYHVVLWGAGSKGVMFLNTVPGATSIDSVVDINPRKQGHYVAGTGQRIVRPDVVTHRSVDVVITMNPRYRKEIGADLDALGVHPDIVLAGRGTAA